MATLHYTGCEVNVGGPQGCKKPCVITIHHQGLPVYIAVADQIELTKWFKALDQSIKMETGKHPKQLDPRQEDTTATLKRSSQGLYVHANKEVMKTNDGSEPQVLKMRKVIYITCYFMCLHLD